MNDTPNIPQSGEPAVPRRRWSVSRVWLIPVVAALIGLSMFMHAWVLPWPEITIRFGTAVGLEADKAQVKYKDVTAGVVTAITVSDDGSHVVATVTWDGDE